MTPDDSLSDWLGTPLGEYVLAREQECFDREVTDLFGFHAVQIGLPGVDLLRASRISCCFRAGPEAGAAVRADPAQLPFECQSIDLVVLPHALEFSTSPHALLREVERVLLPEGHVLLSGFNPYSLFGMRRHCADGRGALPSGGRFISLPRVKDWLKLLGLEVSVGRLCCYAPPVQSRRWLRRLHFLEDAGDRWWALGGGVYFLAAKKRVPGMRLITPCWRKDETAKPLVSVAKPLARGLAAGRAPDNRGTT